MLNGTVPCYSERTALRVGSSIKTMSDISVIAILFIFFIHFVLPLDITSRKYRRNENTLNQNTLLSSYTVKSTIMCSTYCLKNQQCYSYNVVSVSGSLLCQLVGGADPTNVIADADSSFYGKCIG